MQKKSRSVNSVLGVRTDYVAIFRRSVCGSCSSTLANGTQRQGRSFKDTDVSEYRQVFFQRVGNCVWGIGARDASYNLAKTSVPAMVVLLPSYQHRLFHIPDYFLDMAGFRTPDPKC